MAGFTAKIKLTMKMANGANQTGLHFSPNYGSNGAEVNKEWATSTPGLYYQMSVKNEVADKYAVGDEFLVTFEREEKNDGSDSSA